NLTVTDNNGASSTQPVVITVIGTALVIGPGQTLTLSGDTLTNPFIVDDGTILVQSNLTSTILGDVTGTGLIQIKNNSTLEMKGSVGSGLTLLFSVDPGGGANSKLILDDPFDFHAQLSGFQGNDQIDLKGLTFDQATAWIASVTFVGFTGTFKLSSDGNGGTLISDPPASTTTTEVSTADASTPTADASTATTNPPTTTTDASTATADASTTTTDATVTPVAKTSTLTATKTTSSQTKATSATVTATPSSRTNAILAAAA